MTKEEVFKLITGLIIELKDNRKFIEKPELIDDWKARHAKFSITMKDLSKKDQLWLSEKYEIWFKQEFGNKILPHKILQR